MSRDNDSWLVELKSEQESALTDLRDALLRNLRKALSNRPHADLIRFWKMRCRTRSSESSHRIDQFEGRSRFLTWATSIAIRVAMGELRRSRWKDVSLDEVVSDAELCTGASHRQRRDSRCATRTRITTRCDAEFD